MFNSRRLLHTSFIASIFILLSVGVAFWLDKAATLHSSISLFVLFGFSFISYLCGIISINFSAQNYTTIESQAAQNSKLRQDASCDLMTGLYNHHSFVTHLDEYIESFDGERKLCLAILDIDNFKSVNDTYGHDCGDTVLIHLANVLKAHASANSTAYRYGGEEFAIVITEQTLDEASDTVQAILEDFKAHTFPFTNQNITFSAGIAKLASGDNREMLFKRADEMLYVAKREGKNRVSIES
jgi:diguanylate cyclase (GGDEF)-like protein